MSPIKELKWIINNQKSVTTAKLGRLILQFEKVLIKKDKQIRKMTRALNELNHEKQLIERDYKRMCKKGRGDKNRTK